MAKVEKKKEGPKAAVPKPGTGVPESSSSSSTTESELYEPEDGPGPQQVTGTTPSGTPLCPVVKQEEVKEEVKEETKAKEEIPAPTPREAEVVEYQDELVREGLPEETVAPMAAAPTEVEATEDEEKKAEENAVEETAQVAQEATEVPVAAEATDSAPAGGVNDHPELPDPDDLMPLSHLGSRVSQDSMPLHD